MFGKLFRKKPIFLPADLSILGTDVHSHFIPGIDDGAKTMEDSMTLISAMKDFGYKKIVTTPHIMSDYYRNTPEIINSGLVKVREELAKRNIDIQIDAAAEYMIDYEFEKSIKDQKLLTIDGKHVLVELPFISEPAQFGSAIFELQTHDYKPVLAHVERYGFWAGKNEKFHELFDKGIMLQMNIGSLSGAYGPEAKMTAEYLIDNDLIGLVGSDCHHIGHIKMIDDTRTVGYLHKLIECDHLLNKKLIID